MAIYSYMCKNEKCKEFNKEKTTNIPMKDYSEESLPVCECGEKTHRVYSSNAHQTFGDGYKH